MALKTHWRISVSITQPISCFAGLREVSEIDKLAAF
jgi:hypothetical protein